MRFFNSTTTTRTHVMSFKIGSITSRGLTSSNKRYYGLPIFDRSNKRWSRRGKGYLLYATNYGMFHFCIADSAHDWRKGSEQYRFIEHCLTSADRQKQPWLIFAAHRVLGYSSDYCYGLEGSFEEPVGRESLQRLWQKYNLDITFYGHVHNYERTCPIYQNQCVNSEWSHYSGTMNGTIHVVVGGRGSHLSKFSQVQTTWSLYRDYHFGFVKRQHSTTHLLFEYKKSSNGKVCDSFTISRDYRDVLLACVHDGCEATTLAS